MNLNRPDPGRYFHWLSEGVEHFRALSIPGLLVWQAL
jgi:hypothetical protein